MRKHCRLDMKHSERKGVDLGKGLQACLKSPIQIKGTSLLYEKVLNQTARFGTEAIV